LISVRSEVQIFPGPPTLRARARCREGDGPSDWGRSSAGRAPALQAGGHRFDPVRLHQLPGSFLTSRERRKIENGYRRFAPSHLFFGCLTLWIGCKARLDASSRAHAGVCWCVAMGLGSDSARVNEVAKLCRAVVHGSMEGGCAPKVRLLVSSESLGSGF
jgi:hypothetical protein